MQPVILALLGRLDLEPKTLLSKLTVHMNETLACVLAFAQRIGRSKAFTKHRLSATLQYLQLTSGSVVTAIMQLIQSRCLEVL